MAQESFKSISLMRKLKQDLQLRLAGRIFSESTDSDGYPVLLITADATPTTVEANVILRIRPMQDDIARTDGLGLPQRVYTPFQLEVIGQKTAGGDTPDNVPVDEAGIAASAAQSANLLVIAYLAGRSALRTKMLTQADDTDAVVSVADFATAVARSQDLSNDLWNSPLDA